MKRVTE